MSESFERAHELIGTLRSSDFTEIPEDWSGVISEPYAVDPSDTDDPERLLILENLLRTLRASDGETVSSLVESLRFDLEDDFRDQADDDEFYDFDIYLYELVLEDVPLNDFSELARYLLSSDSFLNLTSEWFLRGSFISSDERVSVVWYSFGDGDSYGLFYVRDNLTTRDTVLSCDVFTN